MESPSADEMAVMADDIETNGDFDIDELKLRKSKEKATFAHIRYDLLEQFDDIEVVNRSVLRLTQKRLAQQFEVLIDLMAGLASACRSDGQQREYLDVRTEMEGVEAEFSNAMSAAARRLESTPVHERAVSLDVLARPFEPRLVPDSSTAAAKDSSETPATTTPAVVATVGQDLWRQLKRVSIPIFDGDKRKYEAWKASFEACIDQAPMSAEYKLLQLRQYLKGEALKAIENLGHSAASYQTAKERLERKFGGSRRHIALQMEEIDRFKPLEPGYARDLDQFADLLDLTVINMKEAGRTDELGYGSLYHTLLKKLDEGLITSYHRWVFENGKTENVETLREFVVKESEYHTIASETVVGLSNMNAHHNRKQSTQNFFGRHNENQDQQDRSCRCCGNRYHPIWKCEKFKGLEVPDRWNVAKEKKLCFRCLQPFHTGSSCKRSRVCGINGCTKVHSQLLHSERSTSASSARPVHTSVRSADSVDEETTASGAEPNVTMLSNEQRENYVGLRTIPVILKNGRKWMTVNALLDDGSTKTYLNSDVAHELGLAGEPQQVSVRVLNGQQKVLDTMSVDVELSSMDSKVSMTVNAFTTEKVTGEMTVVDWQKHNQKWPHLSGIKFPKIGSYRKVDMLIGLDYADLHVAHKEVRGKPGEPIARLTPLGWTCVGSLIPGATVRTNFVSTYFTQNIDETLRRFWEVESCIPSDGGSADDRVIMEKTASTMKYSRLEERYEVRIPWKQDPNELPENRDLAIRRLEGTEKRLKKDPDVASAYCENIKQYEAKGYIHKVQPDDSSGRQWFLPHFAVVRPDKTTTKTRIVYDASATCKGVSLNDVIFQGPKLQQDITDVLLRFRRNPVAVACDISEMYLQIEIAPEDRRFFRFLWRDLHTEQSPVVYEFARVVFGVNCSPFLAQFVARQHAQKFSAEFPAAAETVLKSTYMDDSMDSVVTDREGIELYRQLTTLWKLAGMTARKWLSNSEGVLCHIPREDRAAEIEVDSGQLYGAKTLGVLWLAQQDMFTFRFKPVAIDAALTKRTLLQRVSRLFDPLGFLAPYIIRAKILLQKVWVVGADWDDLLDADLHTEACRWFEELATVAQICIPRCLRLCNGEELKSFELHVFADASADAYGAVTYTRCTYESGYVSCHLVCAKTKVAPLESFSIPRLELMAALLGLRVGTSVAKALDIEISKVTFWSDSMNVLCWIRCRSRIFKPFVANRIGEIQRLTNPDQWKYVSTKQNPADVASRGSTVTNLTCHPLWWNGPDFLMLPHTEWPSQPSENVDSASNEMKKSAQNATTLVTTACMTTKTVQLIDGNRYSSWVHMIRVQAWMLRFIHNSRSAKQNRMSNRMSGEISSDEFKDSETVVVKACQQEAFPDEYKALVQKRALAHSSKLICLNPCLDEDGLIRSNSRLVNAEHMSFDVRYPIVLPRKHDITRLIVKFAHEKGSHVSGTNGTLSELSKRYWILSAREAIREWEQSCMTCKRRVARAATQIMAPLPCSRVKMPESLRAFTHTAVDFAGPFVTIQGRGRSRVKRYLCLFTCMSTRAVHLEMAYGLDTDSFLNAFYRFANRRGYPDEVTSDNGTNFVGANRELQQLVLQLDRQIISKNTVHRRLKWNFNPPAGSHFGGVFEIMIKAAKRAVYAILGNADVTDEELSSAFVEVEALLNSRPLTYQSASATDIVPLTPSHFLHGELGRELAPHVVTEDRHPKSRWRRVQEIVRHFWHRWHQEWIPSLTTRKKWTTPNRDFTVGDIVLVMNSQTVRGHWPLGRIVATHPGPDGRVRVVHVQIGDTVFVRPITTLCPLEFTH